MRLLETLRKFLNPEGPIGEVLSPADVYKTRLGLPISSPHTIRASVTAPAADVEKALAPARFVSLEEAGDVPMSRVRQVSAYIEEHYAPVYATPDSTDLMALVSAAQNPTMIGWKVTQRQTAASKPRIGAEDFIEIAQSAQIQATDEFYNGVYPTIPGNDPIVLDGQVLKGAPVYDAQGKLVHDGTIRGTMITKGRSEYNRKTAGMVHWDKGFVKERMKAQAEMDSRPIRNVRQNLERAAGEVLPMRRIVANPRYDRKSGC